MTELRQSRIIIRVLTALAVAALPCAAGPAAGDADLPDETAASAQQGCGRPCGCMGQQGAGGAGRGPRAGNGPGGRHHENIHALLDGHASIERHVEEIEGGVETITTTDDEATVPVLRQHVRQMQGRLAAGQGLRHWDPLFVELFRHHDDIRMEILDVPGGVRVRETSDDPEVVALIRQHAQAVDGFVAEGYERAHRATPLPEGYASTGDPPRRDRWGCGRM